MKPDKQKLLIEYVASSPDVFGVCAHILKPEYFDPEFRNAVEFLINYYTKYNTLPEPNQVVAETGVQLELHELTKDRITYASNEIETFCRHKAVERAILSSPKLIDKGDYEAIIKNLREAITVSLNREMGIEFFDDVLARLDQRSTQQTFITTGYPDLDELIGGGLMRRTITMVQANSGGGKSVAMANLSVNLLESGLNVLYLSLELYEDQVDNRFIAMVSSINPRVLQENKRAAAEAVRQKAGECGRLFIKYMPSGSNANHIRSFLKEFELRHNMVPDVIVLDYLDLMRPTGRVSDDNVFERDKQSAEQFRNILVEYNMIGITASQQNRDAVNATHIDQSHIAGGISKINTVDNSISIIFNEVMKAKGEIAFQGIKTRNNDGAGKFVYLAWDRTALRIRNLEKASGGFEVKKKVNEDKFIEEDDSSSKKLSLMDLMDD